MKEDVVRIAEFSPKVKTYVFLVVAFFLLVTIVGIPILLVWLIGVGQTFSKKYYSNLECKLTRHHLNFKKGVMFKLEKSIPLENIQDITFIQNPILKWLDLRILKVETAGGQSKTGASDLTLVGIMDTPEFKDLILEQRENITVNRHSGASTSAGGDEMLEVLKEIRDLLKNK